MFPEDLFACYLAELEAELAYAPPPNPLPCDRWIARSCLQKAIRRGEIEIALRALARLFIDAPTGVWRHLVVIGLEDLGVAGFGVLAKVVAAARDRSWRTSNGGDWRIAAALVRQMAESRHCQAACDLLMRATNDPTLDYVRANCLESGPDALTAVLADDGQPLEHRGAAVLALGGGLADTQRLRDPAAIFHTLSNGVCGSEVVAICHAAWRICRNPMALLLPLLWPSWVGTIERRCTDDLFSPTVLIDDVPSYSLDQFTRIGLGAIRRYLAADGELRRCLSDAGVSSSNGQARVTSDLLFLVEGSSLRRREGWQSAQTLRLPFRPLPGPFELGSRWTEGLRIVGANASLIDEMRWQQLHPRRTS